MKGRKRKSEPAPKSKNSYLKTIQALSFALINGSSGEHHSDANAVLAAVANIENIPPMPSGKDALANYLKEAKDLDR